MFLILIMPPSNIRSKVYTYQVSLFQKTGHPAALALPPHIPVAFYEQPPETPGSQVQLQPLESNGGIILSSWRYIEIQPLDEIKRLRSMLPPADTEEWYPTLRGIPVTAAALDKAPQEKDVPFIRWKTSEMVCMNLRIENQTNWWEYLEYTPIWRVKLKRRID